MSSMENFSLALNILKEKVLHALSILRKHTNLSKLPPFLANKIFDAIISPILTYSSEVKVHMQNLISSIGTVPISKKHISNFVNVI